MAGLSEGIAHVSYQGGSVFLPARSPYDRELLAAEVLRESHRHDTVQILLGRDRWLVHKLHDGARVRCIQCGRLTASACRSGAHGRDRFCIACAVSEPAVVTAQRSHAQIAS
jgi:hypothetical protein